MPHNKLNPQTTGRGWLVLTVLLFACPGYLDPGALGDGGLGLPDVPEGSARRRLRR